jgi:hypothetical protein
LVLIPRLPRRGVSIAAGSTLLRENVLSGLSTFAMGIGVGEILQCKKRKIVRVRYKSSKKTNQRPHQEKSQGLPFEFPSIIVDQIIDGLTKRQANQI